MDDPSPETPTSELPTAKAMVIYLMDVANMTPDEISASEEIDGLVTGRTIYRWAGGYTVPHNTKLVEVLHDLYKRVVRERTPTTEKEAS